MNDDNYAKRPWGEWEVIQKGDWYKVKKLTIEPNMSISMQYHNHRSEAWCITQGEGLLVLDEKKIKVQRGDTLVIPKRSTHKITATSKMPLIAIEVQLGEITEEDDIVRLGGGVNV